MSLDNVPWQDVAAAEAQEVNRLNAEAERLRAEIIAQCEASLAASEAASHYLMQTVEARNGLRCVLALLRDAP